MYNDVTVLIETDEYFIADRTFLCDTIIWISNLKKVRHTYELKNGILIFFWYMSVCVVIVFKYIFL